MRHTLTSISILQSAVVSLLLANTVTFFAMGKSDADNKNLKVDTEANVDSTPDFMKSEPDTHADINSVNSNVNYDADVDSDTESVEIIDFGEHFEPYRSEWERLLAEEFDFYDRHAKRVAALSNWKWDEVIDISDDDSQGLHDLTQDPVSAPLGTIVLSSEEDILDDLQPLYKKPRVSTYSANRVRKNLCFSDDEDEEE